MVYGDLEPMPRKERERITCTFNPKDENSVRKVIRTSDRPNFNRPPGGGFQFRRADPGDRFEPFFPRSDRLAGRFTRRSEPEEESKPVLKLIDPAAVPRAKHFFDHDDRGKDVWTGRGLYDPRRDHGGDRRSSFPLSGRRFEDRRSKPWNRQSAADGAWTHDKYLELVATPEEKEEAEKKLKEPEHTNNDDADGDSEKNNDSPKKEKHESRSRRRSRSVSRSRSRSRDRFRRHRPEPHADHRRDTHDRDRDRSGRSRRSPPFRSARR